MIVQVFPRPCICACFPKQLCWTFVPGGWIRNMICKQPTKTKMHLEMIFDIKIVKCKVFLPDADKGCQRTYSWRQPLCLIAIVLSWQCDKWLTSLLEKVTNYCNCCHKNVTNYCHHCLRMLQSIAMIAWICLRFLLRPELHAALIYCLSEVWLSRFWDGQVFRISNARHFIKAPEQLSNGRFKP